MKKLGRIMIGVLIGAGVLSLFQYQPGYFEKPWQSICLWTFVGIYWVVTSSMLELKKPKA
jgi:hypothetical protein